MKQTVQGENLTPDGATAIQTTDYRAYLTMLATRKIKGFCGTIDEQGEYYSQAYAGYASLTDSITADYHGRFLIELIQNATDVHPESQSDGEIEIVFDRSAGEHGTLYIANRGAPFSEKNVDALCDMGLSSKPPGESIGNKGLGFRSVHHITDKPLIYSQTEEPANVDRFHGYCFGFADDNDLDDLIAGPRQRTLAQRDLPLFHVPKWLDDQPETITAFARRGFATVISLPLRDISAVEAVEKEISAIRSQTVPLLLFLTRLERLTIHIVPSAGKVNADFSLVRAERPVVATNGALAIADLAEGGKFLLARRSVSEESMKVAIKDGIDKKQLHQHWLQWEGTGEVAIAVRLGAVVSTPRIYTFLPMGEQAVAPFSGYLHGSFFPNSSRKGLDASIRLNALLLDEATTLAATTIVFLTHNDASKVDHQLIDAAKACAVVDLLSWKKVNSLETDLDLPSRVAKKIAALTGKGIFDDSRVIPCLGSKGDLSSIVWCAPTQSRRWPYELDTFSPQVAAAYAEGTGVTPIWPGLDQQRAGDLTGYIRNHSRLYVEFPTPAERAELATRIASDLMRSRRPPIERWSAFYRDLAIFLDKCGGSLAGRELLLCADGKLRRTMTPAAEVEGKATRRRGKEQIEASVFAPPARRGSGQKDDDQLAPPDSLAENFAFLSNRLDWHGEELTPVRRFLENAKLIFEFERDVVLARLSQSIRQDRRKAIMAAGLRWAFQIWREARETGRPFKLQSQHRFFVPNLSGEFIDAKEAIFSETWPEDTLGKLLQRFLDGAPADIEDLKGLRGRRLAPRSHSAFKGDRSVKGHRSFELWVEFLIELGVQKGLRPIPKKPPGTISSYRLQNFSFLSRFWHFRDWGRCLEIGH